ncbi:MAG: thermonuclease family protein [Ruminococcaceae bacterium]|nr:thermonuclease family protein [Oscillospiraceae bacterium]
MKKSNKIISVLLATVMLLGITACKKNIGEDGQSANAEDYASTLKLDMTSDTLKEEVTVKTFIDGDTTHFNVPESVMENGVFKARYLAINTPESTGKIEEYGKTAAAFTKEKLSSAVSIIIESDDNKWNADSTGDRYLAWVWYKPDQSSDYRNLNIEILQNGLAIASNAAGNRYGEIAVAAIAQAKDQKRAIYSGEKDPDFYYGEAIELTLKELRCNIEDYNNMKVAFNGVITMNNDNSVYIEEYDAETDMYYGISIYYGFNLAGEGLEILSVGNESRIVGTVQYYEAGGTYQVSGLTYRQMKPKDPGNIQKISDGHSPAYVLTNADVFANGKIEISGEDETEIFDYAALAMNTSIEMKNLTVASVYTTTNESSSSKGAMTLTCTAEDGTSVSVRTVVLYDEAGSVITEDAYIGKTIDVRGIVDYYDGSYQIKVFTANDITIIQ